MIVQYDSNNSGGYWWLKDDDWLALEKAGWHVEWGQTRYCHTDASWKMPIPVCDSYKECAGHHADSYQQIAQEERFLEAAATSASKEFNSIEDAKAEWSRVTGQDPDEEGCNCCGRPHAFYD